MRICVICSESYDDSYAQCPNCGCPKERYTIEGFGFPEKLNQQYILTGLKRGSGSRVYLSLMSRKTGKKILAGKIPVENEAIMHLILFQKQKRIPGLPIVYEVLKKPSEMMFLFEEIPGMTLAELAEQEYPLDESLVRQAKGVVTELVDFLGTQGQMLGTTDLNSCVITENGIKIADFGGTDPKKETQDIFLGWQPDEKKTTEILMSQILWKNRKLLIVLGILAIILTLELIFLFAHVPH